MDLGVRGRVRGSGWGTEVKVEGRVLGWSQVNHPRQEVCPRAAEGVWEEEATTMGWDESGSWDGRAGSLAFWQRKDGAL